MKQPIKQKVYWAVVHKEYTDYGGGNISLPNEPLWTHHELTVSVYYRKHLAFAYLKKLAGKNYFKVIPVHITPVPPKKKGKK